MDEMRKLVQYPKHRRRELDAAEGREFIKLYGQERLKAARRVFNDPEQIELVVGILEAAVR